MQRTPAARAVIDALYPEAGAYPMEITEKGRPLRFSAQLHCSNQLNVNVPGFLRLTYMEHPEGCLKVWYTVYTVTLPDGSVLAPLPTPDSVRAAWMVILPHIEKEDSGDRMIVRRYTKLVASGADTVVAEVDRQTAAIWADYWAEYI